MKVVLNLEPLGYSDKAVESWKGKGFGYKASSWEEVMNGGPFSDVEILVVRLAHRVTRDVLHKFPNLTHLVSATTGLDHVDLDAVKERQIRLISLRGQNDFLQTIPSTAEHTWALLMALVRNVPAAHEHVKNGGWNRDLFRGRQLQGMTLGIVGYGRTGKKVAEFARAFRMKVIYYDPYDSGNASAGSVELEELMQRSDIVSYHVHLSEDTKHLLNGHNISHLKKNAYLINTSRGAIWQERAVADALVAKKIGGVAVDVLETELDDFMHSPLAVAQRLGMNVIITPHIGGATWDAMWACEEFLAGTI